ncbi:MAG: hypothetical protein ABW061_11720 [Polyangiaceae bacterium]
MKASEIITLLKEALAEPGISDSRRAGLRRALRVYGVDAPDEPATGAKAMAWQPGLNNGAQMYSHVVPHGSFSATRGPRS